MLGLYYGECELSGLSEGGTCSVKVAPIWHRSVKVAPGSALRGSRGGEWCEHQLTSDLPKDRATALWGLVVVDPHWVLLGLSEDPPFPKCATSTERTTEPSAQSRWHNPRSATTSRARLNES